MKVVLKSEKKRGNSMDAWIELEEASRQSGLHPNTLRRLLRLGVIYGYNASFRGKCRWLVSGLSLKRYADPAYGLVLDNRGPKTFLLKSHYGEG